MEAYLSALIVYAAPLILAGIGELLVERTGLVNLGVEGMVALGAAVAVLAGIATGDWVAAYIAAGLATMALSIAYYFFTVVIGAEQIVVGLALFFAGLGAAELIGSHTGGAPASPAPRLALGLDPVAVASLLLPFATWLVLYRTWAGYALRSVGESAETARALGVRVEKMRLYALLAQGFLSGVAGAQIVLSVFYARWYSGVTTGWGWLALGGVVLGYWHPLGVLAASLFTGFLFAVAQPLLAASGAPAALAAAAPYLAVLVALAVASLLARRLGVSPPASVWRE